MKQQELFLKVCTQFTRCLNWNSFGASYGAKLSINYGKLNIFNLRVDFVISSTAAG